MKGSHVTPRRGRSYRNYDGEAARAARLARLEHPSHILCSSVYCPVCNCALDADALRAAIPAPADEARDEAEAPPPQQPEEARRKTAKPKLSVQRTSRSRGRATAASASASSRDSPKRVETLFDQSDSCPGTWYKGTVRDYDVAEGKHLIVYDDGDQQWLNLEEEQRAQQLRWLST